MFLIAGLLLTQSAPTELIPHPSLASLDWSRSIPFKTGNVRVKPSSSDGFKITFGPSQITIGVKKENLPFAKSYLARMVRQCRPKISWRGVHLFVGPTALKFHKKLWTNVLLPLGFNKVVLQCERTEWQFLPNLRGGINMKRRDLAQLCDWYRSIGVEPIPLVQSFGHAEWLFSGGANEELAFNAKTPYSIDPRKPGVAKLYAKLWDEVIRVTKAKTIHFGLDEIALRGIPKDPELVTKLWRIQIPSLTRIANKHKVRMMLWGDECLAPGQAPDSTNAGNAKLAATRRAVLPKGALIGDWHYMRLTPKDAYKTSLALLKREGFQPIACTWYRPENIQRFYTAAFEEGCGVLQTTWAGYESSEANMLRDIKQFSAMVLAADYAWGQTATPDKLGYNPESIFRQMYGP
jgi:hexosaminidase